MLFFLVISLHNSSTVNTIGETRIHCDDMCYVRYEEKVT